MRALRLRCRRKAMRGTDTATGSNQRARRAHFARAKPFDSRRIPVTSHEAIGPGCLPSRTTDKYAPMAPPGERSVGKKPGFKCVCSAHTVSHGVRSRSKPLSKPLSNRRTVSARAHYAGARRHMAPVGYQSIRFRSTVIIVCSRGIGSMPRSHSSHCARSSLTSAGWSAAKLVRSRQS